MEQIIAFAVLMVTGYFFGRYSEKRHYRSIIEREQLHRPILVIASRNVPAKVVALTEEAVMVTGSVVISIDYFKKFVASLRNLVGGRVRAYETLIDRARREAILRMKEEAAALGGRLIFNIKVETASISKGERNTVGCVEVLAYGTAIKLKEGAIRKRTKDEMAAPRPVPIIPEGINVSQEHPLKEFAYLTAGIAGVCLMVVLVLAELAGVVAPFVPLAFEREMIAGTPLAEIEPSPQQAYLQELADRLVVAMDPLDELQVTVSWSDEDTVNAFAAVGGRIFMYRGLVEKLESENALAMVLAHEIAHVKNRDPLVSLGRGVVVAAVVGTLLGSSGGDMPDFLLSGTSSITQLSYSREMESSADRDAIDAINELYGGVTGATDFFIVALELEREKGALHPPAFLSTHPLSQERIEDMDDWSSLLGYETNNEPVPMPPVLTATFTTNKIKRASSGATAPTTDDKTVTSDESGSISTEPEEGEGTEQGEHPVDPPITDPILQ